MRPYRLFLCTAVASTIVLGSLSSLMADDGASSPQKEEHNCIVITNGVLRPFQHIPHQAVGFFTIQNKGPTDLLLNGIDSPLCSRVTSNHSDHNATHSGTRSDDIFKHLAIPHDSTMVFPASEYHLICHDTHNMPQNGDKVPFTFHFLSAGETTVSFTVQNTAH